MGFAGLACRHCLGGYGSGRFFPSTIQTLSNTSKTLNRMHNHMLRCRNVPKEILDEIDTARSTHDDKRAKMKRGSQTAFFSKIWSRLHDNRPDGAVIKPPLPKPSSTNAEVTQLNSSNTNVNTGASPPPKPRSSTNADGRSRPLNSNKTNANTGAGMMQRWNAGMGMDMGMNPMMMGGGMTPMMGQNMVMIDPMAQIGGIVANVKEKGEEDDDDSKDDSKDRDSVLIELSKEPFRQLPKPLALTLDKDKDWLTPLHCFVRKHCVEVFTATELNVQTFIKGKRKSIQVGQIGMRCPHCHEGRMDTEPNRERWSVYYPTSLSTIYYSTMTLLQRHLHLCPKAPPHVLSKYKELKLVHARSGASKKYWIESAKSLGFVETLQGVKLSAKKVRRCPAPVFRRRQRSRRGGGVGVRRRRMRMGERRGSDSEEDDDDSKDGDSKKETKKKKKHPPAEAPPLIILADKSTSTAYSFLLLSQMQPCVFTEADRLGRCKLPTGFAGLACRHCFGGYGSGRFFPSTIKILSETSKTLNRMHNHMSRCRNVPQEILDELDTARSTHDDKRAKMKR
ncbi:hypothetical protein ACHAXR_002474, partial [Thalassiosira sp. AJA248-18]